MQRIGITLTIAIACVSASSFAIAEDSPDKSASAAAHKADMFATKFTGDWGGTRADLASKGILIDVDYTQIFQSNMHGGAITKNGFRASGSGNIELKFDFERMGLWKGGSLLFHAEPRWGEGVNQKVGSLSPVNFDAVIPVVNKGCEITLSEWTYMQHLIPEKLIFVGGKLFGARAFDTNAFANSERTQFMNASLRNNPLIPNFLPYTNWGAALIFTPCEDLTISTAVTDSEGQASRGNFDTAFHGDLNTSIIHEWALKVEPFGLPGTQRLGLIWSSMDTPKLAPKMFAGMPVDPIAEDNISIYYNFDQYVYQEADDNSQGVGVFGRFGWGRDDVNAINYFYSVGVGGKGILPQRDNDTFGIGYYFIDLSNDMPAVMHSEQGVELFYNIEVFPWLHVSPDLQVITNPGGSDTNDVAVVGGVRMQMSF